MYFSGRRKDRDYGGGADDLHDGSDARDNDVNEDDNARHHPLPHGLGLWFPFGCFLQFFLVVCLWLWLGLSVEWQCARHQGLQDCRLV